MKAIVLYPPENNLPWRSWTTIRLENGIICGIRNDHVNIPFEEIVTGMSVKVTFNEKGNISTVEMYDE